MDVIARVMSVARTVCYARQTRVCLPLSLALNPSILQFTGNEYLQKLYRDHQSSIPDVNI